MPSIALSRSASAKISAGVLAAEFERHLADAERRLAHDRLARARLAGEGDAVDEGVLGQELAGRTGPEAVHHVVDALRHAGVVHHLAEQSGGERRLLGRLDHHRVAAGQRRADLPGHQKQRQVPRRDDRDHALRPAQPVIDRAPAVRRRHDEGLGRHPFHGVGEHLEIRGAARDVEVAGEAGRLAGVEALGGEELVEAGVDSVGDLGENDRCARRRSSCPTVLQARIWRRGRLRRSPPCRLRARGR